MSVVMCWPALKNVVSLCMSGSTGGGIHCTSQKFEVRRIFLQNTHFYLRQTSRSNDDTAELLQRQQVLSLLLVHRAIHRGKQHHTYDTSDDW
jgi:hypothetical protein